MRAEACSAYGIILRDFRVRADTSEESMARVKLHVFMRTMKSWIALTLTAAGRRALNSNRLVLIFYCVRKGFSHQKERNLPGGDKEADL